MAAATKSLFLIHTIRVVHIGIAVLELIDVALNVPVRVVTNKAMQGPEGILVVRNRIGYIVKREAVVEAKLCEREDVLA
ncbi:Uncharacterised protein [Pseudomonas luteola]|uniref:Uncharacterized protein n=1 Tax=Pseudomonas luteola TaxID=47886 RepID=A0A2X2BZ15_PSELU|nr:Uncharacterised protein [Pseudomonas luteola]